MQCWWLQLDASNVIAITGAQNAHESDVLLNRKADLTPVNTSHSSLLSRCQKCRMSLLLYPTSCQILIECFL